MVCLDGVHNRLAFLILAGHIHADIDMGAFNLVVKCLADVMQQTGAACDGGVEAQLGGHNACEEGNLQRMVEHILSVAGAVTQTPQQLDEFGMHSVDARLDDGAFALLLDGGLNLAAGLLDGFLNAGGMDASVGDQALKRDARNFPAHRLKAGKGDGLGCVVDNEINARHRLDGADVAALASDNAALHFVVGQRHDGDRGFRHMISGAALNCHGYNLAGGFLRLVACFAVQTP